MTEGLYEILKNKETWCIMLGNFYYAYNTARASVNPNDIAEQWYRWHDARSWFWWQPERVQLGTWWRWHVAQQQLVQSWQWGWPWQSVVCPSPKLSLFLSRFYIGRVLLWPTKPWRRRLLWVVHSIRRASFQILLCLLRAEYISCHREILSPIKSWEEFSRCQFSGSQDEPMVVFRVFEEMSQRKSLQWFQQRVYQFWFPMSVDVFLVKFENSHTTGDMTLLPFGGLVKVSGGGVLFEIWFLFIRMILSFL